MVPRTIIGSIAALLIGTAPAAAAIYMDLGDFPGEATKEPHVDWINVLAVSVGDYRPATFLGRNPSWADSTLQDIVFTKESDKATPKLTESIATGKVHDKVMIDLALSTPTGPEPTYFQIEMEKVRITSQSFSDGGGGARTETITLNPEKIKWVYTEIVDSEEKGKIEFAWDVIGGQPAALPSLPGDYNHNGIVGLSDYPAWRNRLGAPARAMENLADIGKVDAGLHDIWAANFGRRISRQLTPLSTTTVPEPSGGILLGAIGVAVVVFGSRCGLCRRVNSVGNLSRWRAAYEVRPSGAD